MEASKEFFAALIPTLLIASTVPWGDLLRDVVISGGDNPAHPVLVASLREAMRHWDIIHFNFHFWSGFEQFQFYFPLPYLVAASLSFVLPLSVAYKIVTLFGVLLFPFAFSSIASRLKFGWFGVFVFGVLAVSFLFTEAHVMWGGNVFSNLAGMFGNAWAFVFLCFGMGALFEAHESRQLRILPCLYLYLAFLSHFYAILIVATLGAAFLASDLMSKERWKQSERWRTFRFYLHFFIPLALLGWWLIPLLIYRPYSSDFGANWDFRFLETFSFVEKLAAVGALVGACVGWRMIPAARKQIAVLAVFFSANLFLYFSNVFFESTAFINVRLWPSVYFALYLSIGVIFVVLVQKFVRPGMQFLALLPLIAFVPPDSRIQKVETWFAGNFRGIEATEGWEDFSAVVGRLNQEPRGRVSFESAHKNNFTLGSVRALEILPLLTHHDIVEGGILNSASYPGIPYSLQCLTSSSCAGWPPGTLIPQKDVDRAADLMRSLGVQFHIAGTEQNMELFGRSSKFEQLYRGKHLALFQLRDASPLVEVFDGGIPTYPTDDFRLMLLNQFRSDRIRRVPIVYGARSPDGELPAEIEGGVVLSPLMLGNFLQNEWRSQKRVADGGWQNRLTDGVRYLNTFIFAQGRRFDFNHEVSIGLPGLLIADRGFDPDTVVSNHQQGISEVGTVISRQEPGTSTIKLAGRGYRAFLGNRELNWEVSEPIVFELPTDEKPLPYISIRFEPILTERYRYIDITTTDSLLDNLFPTPTAPSFPANITAQCQPKLQLEYHKLVLKTDCVGKPHLLKVSYYPKWRSDVPIYRATNGYMLMTPKEGVTVIRHQRRVADIVSGVMTWFAFSLLLIWWRFLARTS